MSDERQVAAGLLALGIGAGLVVPDLAHALAPAVLPALFCVILFSLVPFSRLPNGELFGVEAATLRIVLWQQFALPLLILAAAILGELPDSVLTLVLVTACAGSLFASPAYAELLDLDRRRALQCMVLSTFVMPLSLFVFLSAVHGPDVHLDVRAYLERAAIFLLLPFVLFALYRGFSGRLSAASSARMEVLSRWGTVFALIVFGIGMMSPVSVRLHEDPAQVLLYLLLATGLGIGMLFLTAIVMHRYGATEAMTAGVLSGFRNVGLGFALLGDMAGSELAVYVGISQIPTFLAPLAMRLVTAPRSYRQQDSA